PMGARLLKRWLMFPLVDLVEIGERHEIVGGLIANESLRAGMQQHLKAIGDIERLVAKVPLKKINPREVVQLCRSLHHAAEIRKLAEDMPQGPLHSLLISIQDTQAIQDVIKQYIQEEPPVSIQKGNVIAEGLSKELDQLRQIAYHGKEYLNQILEAESRATGIPSLKIAFNNVFGYYLEVTNTHKEKVPEHWPRKQTLTSAERYITPELKSYEEKILGADEKIYVLEAQLYDALLDKLQLSLRVMQRNAQIIARIDCLLSLATIATQRAYVRPQMVEEPLIDIKDGRHPVIEQHLPPGEAYVANDTYLDRDTQQIIILTGPNMSGKSALLRQTALITLMAHMGSFVPATAATIGLTDKIFTRVGASDNLSGGESTFMVEMNETASIVNNLSSRSLVLLDEIGRGTSTYDG